jgi:hypothetical protein
VCAVRIQSARAQRSLKEQVVGERIEKSGRPTTGCMEMRFLHICACAPVDTPARGDKEGRLMALGVVQFVQPPNRAGRPPSNCGRIA